MSQYCVQKYSVQSGPMKITVHSTSPLEAAMESLAWWGERDVAVANGEHRHSLDAAVEVKSLEGGRRRVQRFPTFSLLAEIAGRSPQQAWNELLDRLSSQN
jgi:hypothetical protein